MSSTASRTCWLITQWGNRIAHVHIKDGIGIPQLGKFVFPLLGEGRVNWKQFFEALEEIGYDGFLQPGV